MASKAEEYVHAEIIAGRLTAAHIVELVEHFQDSYGLTVDGMPGPATRAKIEKVMASGRGIVIPVATETRFLECPLPTLKDGRKAAITSSFKPSDRPNHVGVDFFYKWRHGDQPDFVGDKGCAGWVKPLDPTKPRHPKWGVPYGVEAVAAANGKVQIAGNSATGYRLWIDHGNGWRTGYFHLKNLLVSVGQEVTQGQPLGQVGDNPKDNDGRHLHFELSPVDRYAPVDPAPYLRL